MDFERAVIKSLFYDYPIESAVQAIMELRNVPQKDEFISILPQLVRWREQAFTTTEARLMQQLLPEEWFNSAKAQAAQYPDVYNPFMLIGSLAQELISTDSTNHYPIVDFEELFRWRDLRLFVGEDLFTTAYYAKTNNPHTTPNAFIWRDTIDHDKKELTEELNKGLSDVHAHYNASADIFLLNWVNVTNALQFVRELTNHIKQYQEVRFTTPQVKSMISLEQMCLVAAWLRLRLFTLFVLEKEETADDCPDIALAMLQDTCFADIQRDKLQAEIATYRLNAMHTTFGKTFDYALMPTDEILKVKDNIGITYHGERNILYQFLRSYYLYSKKAWRWAPYFYLYLLIKTNIRKEFVQINQLKGFENFQSYQDRKSLFIEKAKPIEQIFSRYVVQTTLRNTNDYLEARITPGKLKDFARDTYYRSAFSKENVLNPDNKQLSLVVHLIKAGYDKWSQERAFNQRRHNQDYCRYYSYRKELDRQINTVLQTYSAQCKKRETGEKVIVPLVGIDAASTEMFCRPEVFAPIYRYARRKGMQNQTFHVGEDFFDLVDGLRAIDEAIRFLELDGNCRLGHGLALGTEPNSYYAKRRFRIIAPRQNVLDNFVWLCMTASKAGFPISNDLETELNEKARELYIQIGYDNSFDMKEYWNSMLLRGDDPNVKPASSLLHLQIDRDWMETRFSSDKHIQWIRENDTRARKLYNAYHFNHKLKAEGERIYQGKYENGQIVDLVKSLQDWLRAQIAHKGIAIECNPSSNVKIGHFDRYDEHPLLQKFYPIEKMHDCNTSLLNVSINTDDRGVFATSMYQEMSLIALALLKQKREDGTDKYNFNAVKDYIEHIRTNNEQQRFKVD